MNIRGIGMAAICGTTLMTVFSYVVSEVRKKQFKEPQLLNSLIARADFLDFSPSKKHIAGWLLHYKVGLIFSIIYDRIWRKTDVLPSFKNSLVLGTVTGFFGMMVWNIVFKLHPNPPNIKLKQFIIHLFFAHLLYAYFATKGYVLSNPKEIRNQEKLE